jgi:hypothetical protein
LFVQAVLVLLMLVLTLFLVRELEVQAPKHRREALWGILFLSYALA